jgi:hypothetical protein
MTLLLVKNCRCWNPYSIWVFFLAKCDNSASSVFSFCFHHAALLCFTIKTQNQTHSITHKKIINLIPKSANNSISDSTKITQYTNWCDSRTLALILLPCLDELSVVLICFPSWDDVNHCVFIWLPCRSVAFPLMWLMFHYAPTSET